MSPYIKTSIINWRVIPVLCQINLWRKLSFMFWLQICRKLQKSICTCEILRYRGARGPTPLTFALSQATWGLPMATPWTLSRSSSGMADRLLWAPSEGFLPSHLPCHFSTGSTLGMNSRWVIIHNGYLSIMFNIEYIFPNTFKISYVTKVFLLSIPLSVHFFSEYLVEIYFLFQSLAGRNLFQPIVHSQAHLKWIKISK